MVVFGFYYIMWCDLVLKNFRSKDCYIFGLILLLVCYMVVSGGVGVVDY